jgi:uncharacterized membrane protein YbaN (DUF454 family)
VRRRLRLALDWTVGIALILIGVLGLVLPVLPGVVFIVAGVAILSSHSRYARALHLQVLALVQKIRKRWNAGRGKGAAEDDDVGPPR